MALSFLLLTQASQLTQGSCEGGSCPEAVRESSVLMQRKNRRNKQPLRQAAQAASKSQSVDLFQATAQLLRTGATPDVIAFTNDTLEALSTEIIPNLMHGFDIDSKMVNESFHKVQVVIAEFLEAQGSLVPLREAEAEASKEHHSCREQEQQACHTHEVCHESCHTYNETYISTETEYLAITELIHHKWCEEYGNKSSPVWRSVMNERFSHYMQVGQKRIEEYKTLTTCVTECESKSWKSSVESGLVQVGGQAHVAVDYEGEGRATTEEEASWNPCDEKQHAMEEMSCAVKAHREHVNLEFESEWNMMTTSYTDIVADVKIREELRHKDFKALEGIKCLLKHIVDRAGKPCDEEDEPGEADTIVLECDSYWQIDVHILLMPWNVTYPELPSRPEPVPATAHPCTQEWVTAQYGWLSGECFSGMPACKACPPSPVFDDDEEPICCEAYTAECLACSAKKTVVEYCKDHPSTGGCEAIDIDEVVVQR